MDLVSSMFKILMLLKVISVLRLLDPIARRNNLLHLPNRSFTIRGMILNRHAVSSNSRIPKWVKIIRTILTFKAVLINDLQLKMRKASFSTNQSSASPTLPPSTPIICRRNWRVRINSSKSFKSSGMNKQSPRKGKRRERS